jgi:oxygen-independent coproporphyrinogen-3 oxidase
MTERNPERWLQNVEENGHGIADTESLSPEARADEMLLMGLRLDEGVDLDRLAAVGGLAPRASAIAELAEQGFIERVRANAPHDGLDEIRACLGPGLAPTASPPRGRIRATGAGRFILNQLVLELSSSFEPATPAASPQ